MPIVKKNDTLAISIKIKRVLHDKLDEVRKLAKKNGLDYDPTEAIEKSLSKDLDTAKASLLEMANKANARPENSVDKN